MTLETKTYPDGTTATGTAPLPDESPAACMEMPRYKCHKEVWALKIKEVRQPTVNVDAERYVLRRSPEAGGYYVVYADGYKSYSPAKAFEEGYTLVGS